jgi:hypothetical protein
MWIQFNTNEIQFKQGFDSYVRRTEALDLLGL